MGEMTPSILTRLEEGARAFRAYADGRSQLLSHQVTSGVIRDVRADAMADFADAVLDLAKALQDGRDE